MSATRPVAPTPTLLALLSRRAGLVALVVPRPRQPFEGEDWGELSVIDTERLAPRDPAPLVTAQPTIPSAPAPPLERSGFAPAVPPVSAAGARAAVVFDVPPDTERAPHPNAAQPVTARPAPNDGASESVDAPARRRPGGGRERVRAAAGPTPPTIAAMPPSAPGPPSQAPAAGPGVSPPGSALPAMDAGPGPGRLPVRRDSVRMTGAPPGTPPAAAAPRPVELRIGRLVVDARPLEATRAERGRRALTTRVDHPGPDLEAYLAGDAPGGPAARSR